jgi:hypothetical protein
MQHESNKTMKIKQVFSFAAGTCRHVMVKVVIPHTRQGVKTGYDICRNHVWPGLCKGTAIVKAELIKIHEKQNWTQRFKATFVGNAIGMGIAMLSANLVGGFVEVAGLENMWGLFSKQTVVSETTYKVVSFTVELFVALVVFSIVEYYLDEYKQRRAERKTEETNMYHDDDY